MTLAIHFAISQRPTRGIAYRHKILLALSLKFPKKWQRKSPKIAVVDNINLIWDPRQEERPRISACTLYFQKLESLAYISVTDSTGLSWTNFCNGLQKTHIFCTRKRFVRSRSSKVDDFGTNRKRVCDFLLVSHCNYGPILHCFWDRTTYEWTNGFISSHKGP